MIGTANFVEADNPENVMSLSIIYKIRYSEKVAIKLIATPEAARVD